MGSINIDEEIKKIELEYQTYDMEKWSGCSRYQRYYRSKEGVLEYLNYHKFLCDIRIELRYEERESRDMEAARAGFLPSSVCKRLFGYDAEGLSKISEYSDWQLRISEGYNGLLASAIEGINEDNYLDVFRLCLFAKEKYCENYDAVELAKGKFMREGVAEQPIEKSLFCESVLYPELESIISGSKGKSYAKVDSHISETA